MALTQTQLIAGVSERSQLTKADAKRALPLARAKSALPSVQKARRRLAA